MSTTTDLIDIKTRPHYEIVKAWPRTQFGYLNFKKPFTYGSFDHLLKECDNEIVIFNMKESRRSNQILWLLLSPDEAHALLLEQARAYTGWEEGLVAVLNEDLEAKLEVIDTDHESGMPSYSDLYTLITQKIESITKPLKMEFDIQFNETKLAYFESRVVETNQLVAKMKKELTDYLLAQQE